MPELSGRPLLDNSQDAALFVDREKVLRRALRGARQGVNVLLVGPRGSGKTSTLYRLAALLREQNRMAVLLDGRATVDAADLLQILRWKMRRGESRVTLSDPGRSSDTERLLTLIEAIGEQMAGRNGDTTTVLLDEASSPDVAHQLFGRLRDGLWRLPLTWIVAADLSDRGGYLKPPADAFFSQTLALDPLDLEESRRLLAIRAPALGPDSAVLLAEAGRGNPRALLQMAQEVLLGDRTAREVVGVDARRAQVVRELGEAAQRLFGELAANGGLSVSDPSLLRRLGWSRPRAQQVISRLEGAGLVEAATEPASRGRPRKLYRLRPGALCSVGAGPAPPDGQAQCP